MVLRIGAEVFQRSEGWLRIKRKEHSIALCGEYSSVHVYVGELPVSAGTKQPNYIFISSAHFKKRYEPL